MSLKSLFEYVLNYDFSYWFVYFAIAFGVLLNLGIILRFAANVLKFKELKKDFDYFFETIGILLFLSAEIFIAYLIYLE